MDNKLHETIKGEGKEMRAQHPETITGKSNVATQGGGAAAE